MGFSEFICLINRIKLLLIVTIVGLFFQAKLSYQTCSEEARYFKMEKYRKSV